MNICLQKYAASKVNSDKKTGRPLKLLSSCRPGVYAAEYQYLCYQARLVLAAGYEDEGKNYDYDMRVL